MMFSGKNILIVGASSGMGEAAAYYLHEQGAHVILVSRNEDKLQKIAEKLGERVSYFPFDMNQLEKIKSIFVFCKKEGLKLDGMLFTVGVCDMMPVRSNNLEYAIQLMNLNCMSFLELGKYFSSKRYSNDGSSIVAISSYESTLCDKGQSIYAGSKASLESFAKVMAKEFVSRRIRVNTILPAIVDTPMLHRNQEAGNYSYDEIREIQALGVIEPQQIAYLAAFLLSSQSKFITGESIAVSAGWIGEKSKGDKL